MGLPSQSKNKLDLFLFLRLVMGVSMYLEESLNIFFGNRLDMRTQAVE
jgi:hypothetical protein